MIEIVGHIGVNGDHRIPGMKGVKKYCGSFHVFLQLSAVHVNFVKCVVKLVDHRHITFADVPRIQVGLRKRQRRRRDSCICVIHLDTVYQIHQRGVPNPGHGNCTAHVFRHSICSISIVSVPRHQRTAFQFPDHRLCIYFSLCIIFFQ